MLLAEVAPTTADVGNVLVFLAPGFFARFAYTSRFPRQEASDFASMVWAIAMGVPLIAVGNAFADLLNIRHDPLRLGYVAALLGPALLLGYLVALIRSTPWIAQLRSRLRLYHEADASIYAMTLLALDKSKQVTISLKDGRQLCGVPAAGPSLAKDDVQELYLTYTRWKQPNGEWPKTTDSGMIVPLSEISTITLPQHSEPKP